MVPASAANTARIAPMNMRLETNKDATASSHVPGSRSLLSTRVSEIEAPTRATTVPSNTCGFRSPQRSNPNPNNRLETNASMGYATTGSVVPFSTVNATIPAKPQKMIDKNVLKKDPMPDIASLSHVGSFISGPLDRMLRIWQGSLVIPRSVQSHWTIPGSQPEQTTAVVEQLVPDVGGVKQHQHPTNPQWHDVQDAGQREDQQGY